MWNRKWKHLIFIKYFSNSQTTNAQTPNTKSTIVSNGNLVVLLSSLWHENWDFVAKTFIPPLFMLVTMSILIYVLWSLEKVLSGIFIQFNLYKLNPCNGNLVMCMVGCNVLIHVHHRLQKHTCTLQQSQITKSTFSDAVLFISHIFFYLFDIIIGSSMAIF